MLPEYLPTIEVWLGRFTSVLDRWENALAQVDRAYSVGEIEKLIELCQSGASIHQEIAECKQEREQILASAFQAGHRAKSIKDLESYCGPSWPDDWSSRLGILELQLGRIQRLSTSLCVSAYQSHAVVSELLHWLATGQSESATYSQLETDAISGGQLINEAA